VHQVRRFRLVLWAALSAVLLPALSVRTGSAGDMPSKRYRDPNAKFSLRLFPDWGQVPIETQGKGISWGGTDKFLVAKFQQSGAEMRGVQAAHLHAFRLGKGATGMTTKGETTPGTGMEEDEFTRRMREMAAKEDPTSMKGVLETTIKNYGQVLLLDPKTAKEVKSRDGVVGQLWTVDRGAYHAFAVWKKDDVEIGLWMWCPTDSKKKFEQGFTAVAKSFMFFDPQADDVERLDVLDDLPITPAKRREIEKGLVTGWAVRVSPKKNYIILYNTNNNRNNLLAKVIAERIEKIREQVYEVKFPPAQKIEAISLVRICKDRDEYWAYGGPGGSAGYWNSDTEELVFYDASPAKEPDDDTVSVLYHEAFHQYIYYSVGEVSPHSWFNEGTGDYFAGARYGSGKFTVKPFAWRVGTIQEALRNGACSYEEVKDKDGDVGFKFDRSKRGYTPLKPFVRLTQRDYYRYPGISYAQGWSFIYFLREGVPKNPKWNEKWGKILDTYFDTLKREVNKDKPLVPKKTGKDDPGKEPGKGDPPTTPGMDDPGMGEPGPADPGMGEPGMGEPGAPGMDPDAPAEPGEEEMGIPAFFSRYMSSERALKLAVEAAFKGVDFDELEAAWKAYIAKVH
jgi:hypothetical protein